jgi:hypothetical protein
MKLINKGENFKFRDSFTDLKMAVKEKFTGEHFGLILKHFIPSLETQLKELEMLRRGIAKPVRADEKFVKMTLEIPYSAINIDEDSIEYSLEKDCTGYEVREVTYNDCSISIDNVLFDWIEFDEYQMNDFAIETFKKGLEG